MCVLACAHACVRVLSSIELQELSGKDPWLLGAYSSTFLTTFQAADASGTPATISSCKHLIAYLPHSAN